MASIISQAKKLQNDLAKLDAHYLTNYPTKMNRTSYLKKRNVLKKKFMALKKKYK